MSLSKPIRFPFKRGNKYNAKKTEYKGVMYDSKKEAAHAQRLEYQMMACDVVDVQRQVKFKVVIHGKHCFTYILDFRVQYQNGNVEYHDVKGFRNGMYKLKKKIVEAYFGITIKEI